MYLCRITVMSHGIKVDQITANVIPAIRGFCKGLRQFELKKLNTWDKVKTKVPVCTFASSTSDNREYRFAKASLEPLLAYMKYMGVCMPQVQIVYRSDYEVAKIDLKMPLTWAPRERQVPIIEYCCSDGPIKVVTMQTGQGKTDLTLKTIGELGVRTVVIVPSRYLVQWRDKIVKNFGVSPSQFIMIRGLKPLLALMQLAYLGECSPDILLISSTSWQMYLNMYEGTESHQLPYWFIRPEDFYEKFQVGLRVLDEAHEFFHLNYKMDTYLHVPKSIALSATLDPDDSFLRLMYENIFPMDARMNGGAYIKYIDVTAITYHLEFWNKVRHTGGQGYNHVIYEQWLMKKEKTLANYLKMITEIVKTEYLKKKKPGQKMLIYAATTEMCSIIRDHLINMIDEDLVINRYTSDESFDLLLTSDISVTTLGSAGTGVDVPNLITCLLTTALSSSQRNMQVLGRLRELYDHPDQSPHFLYLACRDITKHMEYHRKKQELFSGKVISHRVIQYSQRV